MKHEILYLTPEDVVDLGVNDMHAALADVEETFRLIGKGDALIPTKVAMEWPEDKFGPQNRINAMPGYLGGSVNMAGVKWIGSNIDNVNHGMPRASALVILNDPVTKYPVCIMDGARISAMRTGASGGMGSMFLAKKDASTVLMCGAGVQARTQLEAACTARNIKRVIVYDIIEEKAKALAELIAAEFGIKGESTMEPEKAVHDADIVITATVATEPIVKPDWIHPGLTFVHMGGPETTYDVINMADKVFTDDWEGIKHRGLTTLAEGWKCGAISESKVNGNVNRVMLGEIPGRESDDEFIFYACVGIGATDVAIATRIYRKALAEKKGIVLPF